MCLQETNFSNNYVANIKQYSSYNKNRNIYHHASGGVATYVNNNVTSKEVPLISNFEAVAVIVLLCIEICICNIYLPNSQPLDLHNLKDLINQLPRPFILLGDFNAHSTLWGCSNTNSRGKIIESLLESEDVILLNSMKPTYYSTAHGTSSSIDLSFCTPDIAPLFLWSAHDTLFGSDHFPILLEITSHLSCNLPIIKWNLKDANWSDFRTAINGKISTLLPPCDFHTSSINKIIDDFSALILKSAEKSVTKTLISSHRKSVLWWNEYCKLAVKSKIEHFTNTNGNQQ